MNFETKMKKTSAGGYLTYCLVLLFFLTNGAARPKSRYCDGSTCGRFQYLPLKDNCTPVNRTNENVFLGNLSDARTRKLLQVGPGKPYPSPSEAAAVAENGDIIEIDAGTYTGDVAVWTQNDLIIRGVGGRAHLKANGANAQGKGIWVIKGQNTTIENIEFSGASVPDQNGAGIRQEGGGLTVRNCYFHDNENGILGPNAAGDVLIEYSEFSSNGYGDGFSHNMYILNASSFTLRYCYVHHSKIGHNVKSRAQKNYILYNRIMDEQTGTSSYAIDLPNGGASYLIGNLIQQGQNTNNSTIISYGAEGLSNLASDLYAINNTIVNDDNIGTFIYVQPGATRAKLINNLFVGPGTVLAGPGDQTTNLVTNNAGLANRVQFDYRLTASSPAINAGSDPGAANGFNLTPGFHYIHPSANEVRNIRGLIDIGAYEFAGTGTSIEERSTRLPTNFTLEQNHPNPFNPETIIEFSIPKPSFVSLKIFTDQAREVVTLVAEELTAGRYQVRWDAVGLPSGVYFCRLETSIGILQRKLLPLK